ncbi:MAG: transcription-repair coupling factor [Cyanobacteria bacterium RYN_339]|nr:transcription-repair coupling factor [Cyanobacteria bacterium RYN_339]
MNQDLLWRRIGANEQLVAERENLVKPGENYRLTGSQQQAVEQLEGWYRGGGRGGMLVAPTGAGKTAVEFRLAVGEFLARQAPVVVLAPTRDLLRQHVAYFRNRLAGTPLRVEELHGGVAPRDRDATMAAFANRLVPILIASGLALKEEGYRQAIRAAGFLVIDDVNAFDPIEHLRPLRGIHTPALYASATPQAVEEFLRYKEAYQMVATLDATPFDTPPTTVHQLRARPGADPIWQVGMADAAIRDHIGREGRIFVISRTRDGVSRLAHYLEKTYEIPVTMLHGEMVDTREQAQRLSRFKEYRPDRTRVAMMERFRETLPAILVGTQLIGSGLDIPGADLIVVTDADGFGEAEIEQLIGRVGRRERVSDAYLVKGTLEKPRRRRR